MTFHSDEERYYMIQDLCQRSTDFLYRVFRRRWKLETGTNWKNDDNHRKMFLDGPGRSIYEVLLAYQKTMLNSAKVEEWDLPLICLVLRRFQSSINYDTENSAIEQLNKISSHLATLQHQTISKSEYDDMMEIISNSLKSLGMKDTQFQGWTTKVGSKEASTAFKQMSSLFVQGTFCEKESLLHEASDCYTDAVQIPNLLPVHVAVAYEERARFCLARMNDPAVDKERIKVALINITVSLYINSFSWSAHHLAAQCHEFQKHFSLAAYHYERARAICPLQMKAEVDAYFILAFEGTSNDLQRPTSMPLTSEEYEKMIEEENNYMDTIIPQVVVPMSKFFNAPDADDCGFDYAMMGFKYYNGWDGDQDFKLAAQLFRKSKDSGNVEGTVALAKCFLYGHGVMKDACLATVTFLAANTMWQSKSWPGLSTPIRGNPCIAEAQHILGRFCFDGKHFKAAAIWYEWSMDNGHGYSATVFGNIIAGRLADETDMKLAKMCWKEGVNLKVPMALKWLLRYYLNELEPDLAAEYFRYGRAAKNPIILDWSEKSFNELIQAIRKYRETKENALLMFEKDCKLTIKGMTFMDRLNRMQFYSDSNILRLENFLRTGPNLAMLPDSPGTPQKLTVSMIKEIKIKAQKGIKTAIEFETALNNASAIRQIFTGKKELTEEERFKIIDLFYQIITIAYHLVLVLDLPEDKILSIVDHLLKNHKNHEEGPTDEKLRICFAVVNFKAALAGDRRVLQALKKGLQRYPNNTNYYIFIIILLKSYGNIHESKHWTEEGLKKDPKNADLLFQLARITHEILKENPHLPMKIEDSYQQFIDAAPKDHRMVPGAYYTIAYQHWHRYLAARLDNKNLKVMSESAHTLKVVLRLAQMLESSQLPCFLPYRKSDVFGRIYFALENQEKNDFKWRKEAFSALEKCKGLFERKYYLLSPTRKLLIRLHRRDFRKIVMMTDKENEIGKLHDASMPPIIKPPAAKTLSSLTPITLQEMNAVDYYCFENRKIELTVLDNSFNSGISICCVVEDDNGDVIRLHIYNADLTEKTVQKFATGTRFGVMNPCIVVENGEKHDWIQVNGLEYVKFLGSVKQMCGFCGEGNASHSCPSCSRLYCGSVCLHLDQERHDHELICLLKKRTDKVKKKKGKKMTA